MARKNSGSDYYYVEDIMSKNLIKIAADSMANQVAKTMADNRVSSILLEDTGKIVGILTERDLVKNVCAPDLLASKTPASAVMSPMPIVTINKNAPIERAADLMIQNRIRHLAVEDGYHNIVGLVTTTDLARYLKEKLPASGNNPTILEALYASEDPYV
jgi:CBS domain-containing protein